MALLLCIETATAVCSVALASDGKILSLKESVAKNAHSSVLTVFIEETLQEAGVDRSGLDAVAVSKGPGSYTGLRIGVATAKGLCYALDKPMIAIGTLEAMAWGMRNRFTGLGFRGLGFSGLRVKGLGVNDIEAGVKRISGITHELINPEPLNATRVNQVIFCPMIDARRMEVYSAIFDDSGKQVRETRAEIIREDSFTEYPGQHTVVFAGDGAQKSRPLLERNPKAVILDDFLPSANYMISLAERKFAAKEFEDLAYFEPFYLKDFVAGKPHVKGLK
ncbi:MAG TPA: tRNA (adenosine(37)-N6)-threonylcarbamoyltransferase complex dimerization subunit type 1 TsaB [Bacteroidales bacterium]|nr:tRNA (adenosine(37)-N6)-threonylcarbamoyltransferase complex dimerization subunit type 1 TsaB [Bacteroidales bacterium]